MTWVLFIIHGLPVQSATSAVLRCGSHTLRNETAIRNLKKLKSLQYAARYPIYYLKIRASNKFRARIRICLAIVFVGITQGIMAEGYGSGGWLAAVGLDMNRVMLVGLSIRAMYLNVCLFL